MVALLLVLHSILSPAALAQSATNFNTAKVAPKSAPSKIAPKNAEAPSPSADPSQSVAIAPSRFVSPTDLDAYVQSLASTFSMANRSNDPFGQLQDPEAKPIKPIITNRSRRMAPTRITPFAEIVRLIQVTTIMPGERRFLIGTRSFKQGDRFPMSFRGRTINVEVSNVTSRKIDFRNLDDGETASIQLKLLPAGMTPGNGQITTPGMIRERANSPLEIDPGNNFNDNSQN